MQFVRHSLTLLSILGLATASSGQETSVVAISSINLGEMRVGENAFNATLTNNSDQPVVAVLDLRATPGMWFTGNQQHQTVFELDAGEVRSIESTYTFARMSPEAVLRVRVGLGTQTGAGNVSLGEVFEEHRIQVGQDNSAALDIEAAFEIERLGLLQVYALRDSYASRRIGFLARERMEAVEQIDRFLGLGQPDSIRLVFYPDENTKKALTGHQGMGWAFGTMIVEVYNESLQLDPYHEVAHILSVGFGTVPSAFDEGLATYLSERLGADALRHLGSPGESVDVVSCRALFNGTAFGVENLVTLDIGTSESRPSVSYPQSASLVKFVVESLGQDSFRDLFFSLGRDSSSSVGLIEAAVQEALGHSLVELEDAWKSALASTCDQPSVVSPGP